MPDNIFKGSYEGASSTGSGQQIHKKAVFFDADGIRWRSFGNTA